MGNGIRARRRNSAKYVWAVYSLIYGIDESSPDSTGIVGLNTSKVISRASGYSVSSTGVVSLVNPSSGKASAIKTGNYLVAIETATSNPATSGDTLYKVTSSSNGTLVWNVGYEVFIPTKSFKGSDTGKRVKSNTLDYPENGIQGNYWYVLLD